MHAARAAFEPEAVPVVLVDEPAGDVAAVDRSDDGLLVLVDRGVALEPVEPRGGGLLAVRGDDRADERGKVGVGRGDRDLALPLGLGKVEDRSGQLRRADLRRVVDEAVHPQRHPDPVCRPASGTRRRPGRGWRRSASPAARASAGSSARASSRRGRRRPGEACPSWRIWSARTMLSFVRIRTEIPVCFSNADTSASVSWGCWPL